MDGCRKSTTGRCAPNEVLKRDAEGIWCCPSGTEGGARGGTKTGPRTRGGEPPCPNGRPKRGTSCPPKHYETEDADGNVYCCPDRPQGECPGGYKPPQVDGRAAKPCNRGYSPKKIDGVAWCCPETESIRCTKDSDCPTGYRCNPETGECKKRVSGDDDGETGECPEGSGEAYEGCACGKYYATTTGQCAPGYVFVPRSGTGWEGYAEGAVGRCECAKWCQDAGYGADCVSGRATETGGGEFKWSGDLEGLMARLRDRIAYLFDYPRGTSEAERQAIINYMTEGVKRAEAPRLQATRDRMARMGLLGSGIAAGEESREKRLTEELLANTKREVAINEIDRRFQELTGTTGMASDLISRLMIGEQSTEAMNAARRGEGQTSLAMMLDYLKALLGTQGAAYGPYLQAILSRIQQGGAGADSSYLPWLIYLLSSGNTGSGLVRR